MASQTLVSDLDIDLAVKLCPEVHQLKPPTSEFKSDFELKYRSIYFKLLKWYGLLPVDLTLKRNDNARKSDNRATCELGFIKSGIDSGSRTQTKPKAIISPASAEF